MNKVCVFILLFITNGVCADSYRIENSMPAPATVMMVIEKKPGEAEDLRVILPVILGKAPTVSGKIVTPVERDALTFTHSTRFTTTTEMAQFWQAYKDFFATVRQYPIDVISSITSKEFDVSLLTLLMNTIYAYEAEIGTYQRMSPQEQAQNRALFTKRAEAVRGATALFNSFMTAASQ